MANFIEKTSRSGFTPRQQESNSEFRANLRPKPDDTRRIKYGQITNAKQLEGNLGSGQVIVEVVFDNESNNITQSSYNRYIVLEEPIDLLAVLYGDLEDLIGLKVAVMQHSLRQDAGIARIVNRNGFGNIVKQNTVTPFGTILSPAG